MRNMVNVMPINESYANMQIVNLRIMKIFAD